jgi:hypothetical protein
MTNVLNQTILKTRTFIVNGKKITVEQVLGSEHRQDIKYLVNGVVKTDYGRKLFAQSSN